ncbi:MAG: glycerol-3-phosphate 1-O-acyltransferase PlsY [Clostridiales Family XIII bacterium]|jgi:glycerol-3-phosphate acyltransferase PlsY|nr:glycerol-3-phosphate 1-O-acyltransferase PlsY [Clostridiales Family XIII bacterium]
MQSLINIILLIVFVAVSYLLGNLNGAILIGRVHGVDVRNEGSGNAGTTNAMRTIGKRAGAFTFLIDVMKGFIPVYVTHYYDTGTWTFEGVSLAAGICGVAVVVGHMWPALFGFRGGKGVATTFGVLLFLDWRLALIGIGIVLLVTVITMRVSAAVLIACICTVPLSFFLCPDYFIIFAAIVILIIVKHSDNIKRLLKGTEPPMSFGKKG